MSTSRTTNIIHLLPTYKSPAIISAKKRSVTFHELHQKVGSFAGGLNKCGVSKGDRILILMPMSIELYISLLASFWIGATVVLVDPSAPLDQILNRFPPKVFIGSSKAQLLRLKHRTIRGLSLYITTGFVPMRHRRMHSIKGEVPKIAIPNHPALLTFTTGSTGIPKAIARSHQFLIDQHNALSHHMYFQEGDIDMPTLPVFLLHSLAGGAGCVLADADLRNVGSVDPKPIISQINNKAVTSISGSPAFFSPIVEYLEKQNLKLSTVKKIFTGGARVNSTVLQKLCTAFTNAEIFIVYGSTEAEPIAVLNGRKYLDELLEGERTGKGALVGFPVDEIEVRIENDEILVAGNHVNPSYYQDQDSTTENKITYDGKIWHRTGDAGYFDEQGRIWLLGRTNGKIAGVWPFPIEARAECFPFVRKAGVANCNNKAFLAVELNQPPENWKTILEEICENVIEVSTIPVDPRHNAKIQRKKLDKLILSLLTL
jgi:olefin beta-lactone synthetase